MDLSELNCLLFIGFPSETQLHKKNTVWNKAQPVGGPYSFMIAQAKLALQKLKN